LVVVHPCLVAGLREMFQLFFKFLWDGCGVFLIFVLLFDA
jgi:hypothetical protein